MAELTLSDVLTFTGGRLFPSGRPVDPDTLFSDISTDTRCLRPGSLFIALKGERFDGHQFARQALDQGAAGIVTGQGWQPAPDLTKAGYIIEVPDTLIALQQLAAGYRRQLSATVTAISGSVGKTSTRAMIAACLAPFMQVHQTEANMNNEIGLPRTLLRAHPNDQMILLELGMRGLGEISLLSKIAAPDIAVLTQIGWSHIERLGSQAAIFQAKSEIIDGLDEQGLLILNADDPWLQQLAAKVRGRFQLAGLTTQGTRPWPGSQLWLSAEDIRLMPDRLEFRLQLSRPQQSLQPEEERVIQLPFTGLHHVRNVLPGLAIAAYLGQDLGQAAAGACHYQHVGNRQNLMRIGDWTVMDDTYNAGPESMQAALESLSVIAGGQHRLIAVLGDMLELGSFSQLAHQMVGEVVARCGYDWLICLGEAAPAMADSARRVRPDLKTDIFLDAESLVSELLKAMRPGDHVLIKGSRALAMEQITQVLLDSQNQPESGKGEASCR